MDALLTELRRDQRLVWDAQVVSQLTQAIDRGEMSGSAVADEVAGLLQRVRYLLEGAA